MSTYLLHKAAGPKMDRVAKLFDAHLDTLEAILAEPAGNPPLVDRHIRNLGILAGVLRDLNFASRE